MNPRAIVIAVAAKVNAAMALSNLSALISSSLSNVALKE